MGIASHSRVSWLWKISALSLCFHKVSLVSINWTNLQVVRSHARKLQNSVDKICIQLLECFHAWLSLVWGCTPYLKSIFDNLLNAHPNCQGWDQDLLGQVNNKQSLILKIPKTFMFLFKWCVLQCFPQIPYCHYNLKTGRYKHRPKLSRPRPRSRP